MKIKISRYSYLIRLVSFLFFNTIGITNKLIPLRTDYRKCFKQNPKPIIFAIWHSQLLLPIYYFCGYGFSAIISNSEDGEIITQAVKAVGVDVIRGSSSRNGARGLLGLVRKLKEGKHVVITPDGPRGPNETVQMGIIALAKMSGHAILPTAFDCSRKRRLNSWDHFIVPYPFGKIVYDTGDFIHVPEDADEQLMEEKRGELELVLKRLTRNVNHYMETQP